jgi:uncharacterized protein (UPF0335 family)
METNNKHKEMEKPLIVSAIADNGQHSHWILVENETGDKLWSENGIECKAMGYPVKETEEAKALKQQNEELIEQTTKLQSDKDRLAEQLKEAYDAMSAFDYPNTRKIIKQTLSECGYNI